MRRGGTGIVAALVRVRCPPEFLLPSSLVRQVDMVPIVSRREGKRFSADHLKQKLPETSSSTLCRSHPAHVGLRPCDSSPSDSRVAKGSHIRRLFIWKPNVSYCGVLS